MLDTLAEVGRAPDTTLDLGVRAAASLATAYLARKDRVGLINYGGLIHWVRPGSGRIQYERLADALARAGVVFTYVAKDLAMVPPRVLPPQALVIAVTSLLDPRFTKAALDLAARGFDLVVLVVSPVEVTRATLRPSPTTDLSCRLWAGALCRVSCAARAGRRRVAPSRTAELALAGHAAAGLAWPRRMIRLAPAFSPFLFGGPLPWCRERWGLAWRDCCRCRGSPLAGAGPSPPRPARLVQFVALGPRRPRASWGRRRSGAVPSAPVGGPGLRAPRHC
jgi:hypothetical protein